ncbi:MAG: hypothetical protein VX923_00565 [Pseudomonadota bacterium]|nr:hypothetical protein [Pseudomonadota bacterium]
MFGPIGFGAFVTWNQEEKQTIRQKIKFEEVTGKKFSSDDEYTDDYKKFKRQHSYLFDNTPKVAGWGVGIAFAIVLIIIGKSPIHDEARSSKSSTSYSSKQKRDYLKKLEGAAGKYYDKNCARSTSGC